MGFWTKSYGGWNDIPEQDARNHFGRGRRRKSPKSCHPMGKPWWL